jgi:hypothetical protein
MYEKKECIASSEKTEFSNKLLFLVRGTIVQKGGEYDTPGPRFVYQQGNIVGLRKLVSLENTNLFCHESSRASVVPIDLDFFKKIISEDKDKYEP